LFLYTIPFETSSQNPAVDIFKQYSGSLFSCSCHIVSL
jgi:hypothetical protein